MFPKLSLKQLIGALVLAGVFFACLPGAINGVPLFVLLVVAVLSFIPVMLIHGFVFLLTSGAAHRDSSFDAKSQSDSSLTNSTESQV